MKLRNKKVRGKNKFQESWLNKEEYKVWLEKGVIEYAARCKLCRKEICVDNMGKSFLKSHMSTVKHLQLAKERTEAINNLLILHFCKPKNSDPSTEKCSSPTKKQSPDFQEISVSSNVVSAEVK